MYNLIDQFHRYHLIISKVSTKMTMRYLIVYFFFIDKDYLKGTKSVSYIYFENVTEQFKTVDPFLKLNGRRTK